MAKCKNCTNLHEHWCEKIIDSPCEDTERDCDQYKCMTQAERIRSMTDEELAEWFSTVTDDVLRGSTWSKDGWMKYLQSEVEQQVAIKLQTHGNAGKIAIVFVICKLSAS